MFTFQSSCLSSGVPNYQPLPPCKLSIQPVCFSYASFRSGCSIYKEKICAAFFNFGMSISYIDLGRNILKPNVPTFWSSFWCYLLSFLNLSYFDYFHTQQACKYGNDICSVIRVSTHWYFLVPDLCFHLCKFS